jgi:hypothetical protein
MKSHTKVSWSLKFLIHEHMDFNKGNAYNKHKIKPNKSSMSNNMLKFKASLSSNICPMPSLIVGVL